MLDLNDGARHTGSDYFFLRFGNPSNALELVWAEVSHLVGSAGKLDADIATLWPSFTIIEVYKSSTLVCDVIWVGFSRNSKPLVRSLKFQRLKSLWTFERLERRLNEG